VALPLKRSILNEHADYDSTSASRPASKLGFEGHRLGSARLKAGLRCLHKINVLVGFATATLGARRESKWKA
jgi:hypothetical protein